METKLCQIQLPTTPSKDQAIKALSQKPLNPNLPYCGLGLSLIEVLEAYIKKSPDEEFFANTTHPDTSRFYLPFNGAKTLLNQAFITPPGLPEGDTQNIFENSVYSSLMGILIFIQATTQAMELQGHPHCFRDQPRVNSLIQEIWGLIAY